MNLDKWLSGASNATGSSSNKRRRVSKIRNHNKNCDCETCKETDKKQNVNSKLSKIGVTSLQMIFNFLPPFLLFKSVPRVCKVWNQLIKKDYFIIGYFKCNIEKLNNGNMFDKDWIQKNLTRAAVDRELRMRKTTGFKTHAENSRWRLYILVCAQAEQFSLKKAKDKIKKYGLYCDDTYANVVVTTQSSNSNTSNANNTRIKSISENTENTESKNSKNYSNFNNNNKTNKNLQTMSTAQKNRKFALFSMMLIRHIVVEWCPVCPNCFQENKTGKYARLAGYHCKRDILRVCDDCGNNDEFGVLSMADVIEYYHLNLDDLLKFGIRPRYSSICDFRGCGFEKARDRYQWKGRGWTKLQKQYTNTFLQRYSPFFVNKYVVYEIYKAKYNNYNTVAQNELITVQTNRKLIDVQKSIILRFHATLKKTSQEPRLEKFIRLYVDKCTNRDKKDDWNWDNSIIDQIKQSFESNEIWYNARKLKYVHEPVDVVERDLNWYQYGKRKPFQQLY